MVPRRDYCADEAIHQDSEMGVCLASSCAPESCWTTRGGRDRLSAETRSLEPEQMDPEVDSSREAVGTSAPVGRSTAFSFEEGGVAT